MKNNIKLNFEIIIMSLINFIVRLLRKKHIKANGFDKTYGFILKHNIDNKHNYNAVKAHHSQSREACQQ